MLVNAMGFCNIQCQVCISYFLLLQVFVFTNSDTFPVVSVIQGQIRGVEQLSRDGKTYYAFLGVPYASVPLRFESPQPFPQWSGVRNATAFGSVCPQLLRGSNSVIGTEECLFLNIFTPNLTGTLPVIVYIHGGAYMTGSGNMYGGAYFLDEDVILITINYRLGALGFLSTGDGMIQGNNGLRDQNMALKWIKSNVKAFGGDKSRITLMGESAGAASVCYHLLSPMSKGLFQNAIAQSGSALDPEHFEMDPLSKAIDLAESIGCPTSDTADLAACLQEVDFKKIVQIKFSKWHLDPLVEYPPSLDVPKSGLPETNMFLPELPIVLLQEGRFNKVPFVTGIMEEEGLLFHSAYILSNYELQRSMNQDWNYVAPITLYYDNQYIPNEERNQISRTIRGFYFGDRKIETDTSRNLTNMYSDRLFNWGTRTTALLQSKFVPVYTYILGFLGDFSMLQIFYKDLFRGPIAPTHGDDLQYFFNSTRYPDIRKNSRAEQISKTLVELWASFASSGNMMKSLNTLKIAWLPIGPEEIKRKRIKWCYIDIESKILTRERFGERMDFWDKITSQIHNVTRVRNSEENSQISSMMHSKLIVNNKDEL